MNEKQRRRIRRERIRRRRRRIRIAVSVLGTALIITVVLLIMHFGRLREERFTTGEEGDFIIMHEGEETIASAGDQVHSSDSSNESDASGTASAVTVTETAVSAGGEDSQDNLNTETLNLTEDQKYTGDLILVNSHYAYDFERNQEFVQLVRIKEAQSWKYPVDKEEFMVAKRIIKSLDSMIHDCDQTMGTNETGVSSAYRSEEYQMQVWEETADEYGDDYAASYVARPGFSEHHTGLAVDLGIFYDDGEYGQFSGSANAEWMAENCWKYGFVRRYAEDKIEVTGISNEAWHFRYVGLPHAAYMSENNLCLEEYLDYLKENTDPEHPLLISFGDGNASVYYTASSSVPRPSHRFDVSGDNRGGWIITIYS